MIAEHARVRQSPRSVRDAFALRAKVAVRGRTRENTVIPDLVCGSAFTGGSCRYFMGEIDRGTMPVTRSDPDQSSFARKMRTYLAAYAAKLHMRQLGLPIFRVLTVTTDDQRRRPMLEVLRGIALPRSIGPSFLWFATFDGRRRSDPPAVA